MLSARFTVYSYDRRGRGDSARYAVSREIEDLAAMIGAAGGNAHVWGLSSGAVLVMCGAQKESPAFLRHAAAAVAAALPDARLVEHRGLGHTKALNTKVIAAVLTEFLTSPGAARGSAAPAQNGERYA